MKALIFLGSRRQSTPPHPPRLGERVCAFVSQQMGARFDLAVVDPLDYPPTDVFRPSFAYGKTSKPTVHANLEHLIRQADAYVMLSPEYNHSMSPALSDLLNHFPSSAFSFKPSLIVTYSSGQWGGTRAAVGMRTFLSELGCLPVSAMVHVPHADQVIEADGTLGLNQDLSRWKDYLDRGAEQLHWWAMAAADRRRVADPFAASPAFSKTPAERNAPKRGHGV